MPKIDLNLIGRKSEPKTFDYTWKDVVLYALGVGATAQELDWVYESAPAGLKVLPSFCVVPAIYAWPDMGADFQWPYALHGEQRTRWHRPLPASGRIVQAGEVVDIYDKGKGALIRVRVSGKLPAGEALFEAEWSLFYLGGGGFGGPHGPKTEPIAPPEGVAPDFSVDFPVAENQAALYRLNGDVNPLHIDPAAACLAGFDRPILHGLCTYGFATRAIIQGLLDGQHERLREFNTRFSGPVFPGDTLTVEGWLDHGRCIVEARTRRSVVLTNAVALID
ncbi:MAG: MaoC/PaaZ C-terminal domain-containing protein [Desulfobacterales bacterium]